jgi:hypothetical protein
MQHIAFERLRSQIKNLALQLYKRHKWPTYGEFVERIEMLSEYQAAVDVRVPELNCQIDAIVKQQIGCIPKLWLEETVHECLSLDELQCRLVADSGGGVPEGYLDAMTIFECYYKLLLQRIQSAINDVEFEDDYELEIMIPLVKSPFFDRNKIKDTYYTQLELKKKNVVHDTSQQENGKN